MLKKILKHWKDGDLMRVTRTYLNNFSIQRKFEAWKKVKETGTPVIVRIGRRSKMKLYTDSFLSEPIYTGRFEQPEIDFVQTYLRQGDIFLDIGANVGLFTIIAAETVGQSGKVYSFEPVSLTFSRLKENSELNKFTNTTLTNAGLSDSDGTLEMITSTEGYDAWNSFGRPTAGDNFKTEVVNINKLDTWIDNIKPGKISLIKIDVEGWELNVLKGGVSFLSQTTAPHLLVEFTEENCRNAGTSCRTLYMELEKLGYSMFSYDHFKRKLIPEPIREIYTHQNIIASKNILHISERLGN